MLARIYDIHFNNLYVMCKESVVLRKKSYIDNNVICRNDAHSKYECKIHAFPAARQYSVSGSYFTPL